MKSKKINTMVKVGMLSAIAVILQYLGSMMGIKVGGFLDVEISDYPAIIGALALGPVPGLLIELIKNLIHLLITHTGFIGEAANFAVNGVFVLVVGIIYQRFKTKKGALLSLFVGTVIMTIAAIATNYFVMLPLYMPTAPPQVRLSIVLSLITPFNFARGMVLSLITMLTYKKLSPILHNKEDFRNETGTRNNQ